MKVHKIAVLLGVLLAGSLSMGQGSAMAAETTVVSGTAKVQTVKAMSRELPVTPDKTLVNYIPDVVYEQVPSRGYQNAVMQMDIMQPQKKEKLPAVVFVTGGGFINANRANGLQERMRLADEGYLVASITYRVAPTAKFPEPLEDVKAAIRYLRANADKFNIDKERIGIIGGSAGGYLSAMAGTTSGTRTFDKGENIQESSNVKCAVDLFGLSDLTCVGEDFSAAVKAQHKSAGATEALWVNGSPVFGGRDGGILADPQAAEAANPIHYISASSAPMLLMHGSADKVVSPSQTDHLFQALRQKGIPSERYVIPNAAHGGIYWVQDKVMDVIVDFFNTYLRK